jgi:hypothetical protein
VSRVARRRALYAALGLLYLLHNDLWLWHDPRLVFGLPAGLAYHVGFAAATAVVLALLVAHAWPAGLDALAAPPDEEPPAAAAERREGR